MRKRLLQVVARHESEPLEVLVRARQILVGLLKIGVQLGQPLRRADAAGDIAGDLGSADHSPQCVVERRNSQRHVNQFAVFGAPDGFEVVDPFSLPDTIEYAGHLIQAVAGRRGSKSDSRSFHRPSIRTYARRRGSSS